MSQRYRHFAGAKRHMHGYRREFHDPRDRLYAAHATAEAKSKLSASASTRKLYQPPVRDQNALGSCTANAGCEAAGYLFHKQTSKADPLFSRLSLYASTRKLEGTPLIEDSGAYVRDVFKAMTKFGVCFEKTWPYKIEMFSRLPPATAQREALNHQAIVYLRCQGLADIKASIAAGYPVIGGFTCFESLDAASVTKSGDVPLPASSEAEIGGHCVYFDSYDDAAGKLGFQNSWGSSWGRAGFGRLPYGYVTGGLAADFWTLRREET